MGIFREMFWMTEDTLSLRVSPRACHAFPAIDSTFLHDGFAYVCLEDFPAFTEGLACAPLEANKENSICIGNGFVAHVGETCLDVSAEAAILKYSSKTMVDDFSPETSFSSSGMAIRNDDGCYTIIPSRKIEASESLSLRMVALDGNVLWEQLFNSENFTALPTP